MFHWEDVKQNVQITAYETYKTIQIHYRKTSWLTYVCVCVCVRVRVRVCVRERLLNIFYLWVHATLRVILLKAP